MVAEYTSTLDNLSGGKFLFGVGQGYREVEFNSFGIEKRHRKDRLVEPGEFPRRLRAAGREPLAHDLAA